MWWNIIERIRYLVSALFEGNADANGQHRPKIDQRLGRNTRKSSDATRMSFEPQSTISIYVYFNSIRTTKRPRIQTELTTWIGHLPSVECVGLPTLPPNVLSMSYPNRLPTCHPFMLDLLVLSVFSKAHVISLGCVANTTQQIHLHAIQRNW